jgi:hypothetical protein
MKTPHKEKYHRSVEEDRFIYVIHAPHCNDFFIWHCKKDLWKASYKRHLCGQRKQTADLIAECAKKGYLPCFHVLEEVHLTQIMAYRHVIAWNQILYIKDYEPLAGDKTLLYMTEMQEYTESVFNHNKNADLDTLLSCKTCLIENCPRKQF